ncbi:hypothetical protein GCM10010112_68090 [Actinoplanes lobatus]|uniref:Uncharacterized protein n=1 Tax=Actinoplanes lobatus TaxID=113568 RepID=A0A7W7HEM2_9ACTN|nr:hypothetical protein [Actinoplanes lobatus]MBB4749110.1 hypothetical protein [Actinoplanes lobatus]GGN86468.1 hypothetical protein GCM10010112_68090 [Actinoplanes lobatus]GIE42791.1 hypothetical protein Alo02nite_56890 [Actinoplanes lobatus]
MRRAVRMRIFDGQHEVLHRYKILHMVDLDSPALPLMVAGLLAQGIELALALENEEVRTPRLELWCAVSEVKVYDHLGGLIL